MENAALKDWSSALVAGMAGAVALTAVHQVARRVTADAPRMDVLGERAIARIVQARTGRIPVGRKLNRLALVGDLVANAAFYSMVACGKEPRMWRRAVAMGLAAGAGALMLPRRIGLGDPPNSSHLGNQIMTVAWYLIGGLAAAAAGQGLRRAQTA